MTDDELLQWAETHAEDPRAAKIKGRFREAELTRHGNATQRFDAFPSEGAPVVKAGLNMAGLALGGPIGGAVGNVVGGKLEEAAGMGKSNVLADAAWGGGPAAVSKTVGVAAQKFGKPALAKAVGYLTGKPTRQAAAEGGVNLDYVDNPQLQKILGADTPGGSQIIAEDMAANVRPQVGQAMYGDRTIGTKEAFINGKGNVSIGNVESPMSTPLSPMRVGQIADNASQLSSYAAPQSKLAAMTESLLGGTAGRVGRAAAGAIGPASPAAARYLSAAAQAADRGLPLSPELEALLQSSPGQRIAMPALSTLISQYAQRNK